MKDSKVTPELTMRVTIYNWHLSRIKWENCGKNSSADPLYLPTVLYPTGRAIMMRNSLIQVA